MTIFFDANGYAHETCAASDPGAGAFGPSGVSRRLTDEECRLWLAAIGGDETHRIEATHSLLSEAFVAGLLDESGEWPVLVMPALEDPTP